MLQELIKKIEAKIEEQSQREVQTIINHASRLGKIVAYEQAIQLLTDANPQFEECIKKAWLDGGSMLGSKSAQDYYNQNYKNEKHWKILKRV